MGLRPHPTYYGGIEMSEGAFEFDSRITGA